MSFATYIYRKILLHIRNQQQHALLPPERREHKVGDTVSFSDDTSHSPRGKRQQSHTYLRRKMSFAGGVDGHGQCIAILTSGGDSQGGEVYKYPICFFLVFHLSALYICLYLQYIYTFSF